MTASRMRPTTTPYLPRAFTLVAVIVALLLVQAGTAAAYWSTTGTGTGTAATATLAEPTPVTAAVDGAGSITVTWGASAGSPAATGYYVLRTLSGGATTAACDTSPAAPTPGTTCTDTPTAAGTYTYTVVAVLESWTATGGPSNAVVSGPANMLGVGQNPSSSTQSGQSIGTVIFVLKDSNGNDLRIPGVTVTVTLTTPAGATLSGTTTALTDGNGKATFNDLSIDKVGTYTLTGTADGYTSADTSAVTITAGRATNIAVHSGSPQTTPVGTEFAEPVVALVTDSAGNPVSGQVVQFATPSGGASGTFTANNNNQLNVITGADGTASAGVRANNTAGAYSVQATGTRLGELTPFATTGFALTNTPVAAAAAVRARTPVLDSTSIGPGATATTPESDTSSDARTSTTTSSAPATAEAGAPTPPTTSVTSSAAVPTGASSITSVTVTASTEVTATPPSTTGTVTVDIPPSTPLPTETLSPPGASQSSSPSSTATSADTTQ